jgi:hypothetical protein
METEFRALVVFINILMHEFQVLNTNVFKNSAYNTEQTFTLSITIAKKIILEKSAN